MADNKVIITRIFDAPIERVWQVFTEPELIKKWWGPKDFTAPHITSDFREGGKYLYAMHGPAGTDFDVDMWTTGAYKQIVPLQKIVRTSSFSDAEGNIISPDSYGMTGMPEKMELVIEFEATPDGKTKLTLTHDTAPVDSEQATNMEAGWNQSLDKLEAAIK